VSPFRSASSRIALLGLGTCEVSDKDKSSAVLCDLDPRHRRSVVCGKGSDGHDGLNSADISSHSCPKGQDGCVVCRFLGNACTEGTATCPQVVRSLLGAGKSARPEAFRRFWSLRVGAASFQFSVPFWAYADLWRFRATPHQSAQRRRWIRTKLAPAIGAAFLPSSPHHNFARQA
jgi:hypothetical protein